MSEMDSHGFLKEREMMRLRKSYTKVALRWVKTLEISLPVQLKVLRKRPDDYVAGYQDGYKRAILELKGFVEDYETEQI